MSLIRVIVLGLSVLVPATWTIASAADQPAAEGAKDSKEPKKAKKAKKAKKTEGAEAAPKKD